MQTMIKKRMKITASATALIFLLSSCGVILYPERRGGGGGRLDPAIVVLDGIGLLFFFVPGVVAFAVDFATGAIYLSGGRRAQLTPEELQIVMAHQQVDMNSLSAVLKQKSILQTDTPVADWQVQAVSSTQAIEAQFEQVTLQLAQAEGAVVR